MESRPAHPKDLKSIRTLLTESDLTTEGLADHLDDFLVVETGGEIVAVAGLEVYGACALLRSVAVRADRRKHGQGRVLVDEILRHAAGRGVGELYLLTTTAAPFFSRMGFELVDRGVAPESIRSTREFSQLCPQSADFMRRLLD